MFSSSTGGTNPTVTCFRADLIGNDFIASLRAEGLKEIFLPYQQERGSKRWESVLRISDRMNTFMLDRRSAVIALGALGYDKKQYPV